jgi:hypothetical protein
MKEPNEGTRRSWEEKKREKTKGNEGDGMPERIIITTVIMLLCGGIEYWKGTKVKTPAKKIWVGREKEKGERNDNTAFSYHRAYMSIKTK